MGRRHAPRVRRKCRDWVDQLCAVVPLLLRGLGSQNLSKHSARLAKVVLFASGCWGLPRSSPTMIAYTLCTDSLWLRPCVMLCAPTHITYTMPPFLHMALSMIHGAPKCTYRCPRLGPPIRIYTRRDVTVPTTVRRRGISSIHSNSARERSHCEHVTQAVMAWFTMAVSGLKA